MGKIFTPPAKKQVHLLKQKALEQERAVMLTDGTWRSKDPHIRKGDATQSHFIAHQPRFLIGKVEFLWSLLQSSLFVSALRGREYYDHCYGQDVCVSQHSYIETMLPQCDGIRRSGL